MSGLRTSLHQLRDDERGATIVEFAFVVGPMLLLLMGGLELGYNSYVRSTMQGALNDAARTAAVEFPIINVPGSTVEEQVENLIEETVKHVAPNASIEVTQKSYFEFSAIGNPEKLMTDNNGNGQFDADDNDCWEDANGNGSYDTDAGKTGNGGADDVVLYSASISTPRILPLQNFLPGVGPTMEYTLQTAVRNQPYDKQATAAVICA
ncbi:MULTISPECIES: TadE/TadG family type IV pilus assembly protein [Qipengyuania]|uniref:TadE/TadG family type IV pilus assembly protein n=1 Tax=Qipengyuania TaxID=1855416 RepID=UPI002A18D56A|nr:TadE/TadG family type IV pilus assembly protein [Qipengyuania sp. HL-TH1]WPL55563.1 TadE/TadG family type IV pilus assembly protein [Qipengyuania sp. HL-TH5]